VVWHLAAERGGMCPTERRTDGDHSILGSEFLSSARRRFRARDAGEQGSRGAGEQGSRGAGEQGRRAPYHKLPFSPAPFRPFPAALTEWAVV